MIKKYTDFTNESFDRNLCLKYGLKNWTLNSNGLVDVDGDVYFGEKFLTKIPINFGKVTGDFYCSHNQLKSLEGCPTEVGGNFDCNHNKLISLKGSPKSIGEGFYCYNNQLTTLEGGPKSVGRDFYCSYNQLTTFKGCPESISGYFGCSNNKIVNFYEFPDRLIGINLYLKLNPLGEIYHGIFKEDSRCIDLLNMTRSIYKNEVREMGIEDIAYTMNFELDEDWRDYIRSYKIVD
jgi:hypothetical protein